MKIAIVGYSGSGKSTLARTLGKLYGVDVLHLDAVHFLPNWEIRNEDEKQAIVREFLNTHEGWVIDGNYTKQYQEERLAQADMIILLLFNRFNCLWRVTKRYWKYKNTTRPDMAVGCNEKLDKEFVRWVLLDSRTKKRKDNYRAIYEKHKEKAVILKNQRQMNAWLKKNFPDTVQ